MQAVSVLDSLLVALSPGLDYLAVATQDGRLRAFETGEAAALLLATNDSTLGDPEQRLLQFAMRLYVLVATAADYCMGTHPL